VNALKGPSGLRARGSVSHEVHVQSRRSRFFGKGGGAVDDSVVVHRAGHLVFEAIPWAEQPVQGLRAFTPRGTIDVEWPKKAGHIATARVRLDGALVGESLEDFKGTSKIVLALTPSFPPELVPFVMVAIRSGPYERRTTRSRPQLTENRLRVPDVKTPISRG
jgi:hypothetical protein